MMAPRTPYTAGPWSKPPRTYYSNSTLGKPMPCADITIKDANGKSVCAFPSQSSRDPLERDANVTLIAAAPDLAAIARRWLALEGGAWNPERNAADRRQLLADTRTALETAGALGEVVA